VAPSEEEAVMARLAYVIKFVADMDRGVAFYSETFGFPVKMKTPFWSELDTGETVLALHPASDANPAGSCQLGFNLDDLQGFYERGAVAFSAPPREQHGTLLARMIDCEGAEVSLSG
jgi:catechol 2,3-dioxygenase-like lactoylglutathione lyase family enzyme